MLHFSIQTCAHLTSFLYSPLIQSHINKNDECTTLFPQGLRTLMCTVSNEILINISECCTVDSSMTYYLHQTASLSSSMSQWIHTKQACVNTTSVLHIKLTVNYMHLFKQSNQAIKLSFNVLISVIFSSACCTRTTTTTWKVEPLWTGSGSILWLLWPAC